MTDGEQTPAAPPLRPAAPIFDGPLASSGAAPDPPAEQQPTAAPESTAAATAAPEPTTGPPTDAVPGQAGRRVRVPFAHALRRLPPPRHAVVSGARAIRAWSRRPSGRLALPALLLFALVAVTGAAGAILVPATARAPRPVAVDSTGGLDTAPPGLDVPVPVPGPTDALNVDPSGIVAGGRPSDVLADWARQTGERTGVPAVAMQAYGYAELVLAQTTPNCRLTWTTLAAIGHVESAHGHANGATLRPDGRAVPEIIGLPLDGKGGRQRILDTDGGQLDGDTTYDRAVGPMQFIPSTWRENGADADNDGVKDPHNIHDAALAAGNYLCKSGRDLSVAQDWWNAILSYNNVRSYAQAVYDTANQYGVSSRT